jgi:dye decolorizing peroxidase
MQWRQDGYVPVADAVEGSESKRNLMGQVDGTVNPKPNTKEFNDMVWVTSDDATENNGTVMVLRRIKLLMDEWDTLDVAAQEGSIGRQRGSGAPIGGSTESEDIPLDKYDANGLPVIPLDSHARVARGDADGPTIFRRPYNYDAGLVDGEIEFGQLFVIYANDLKAGFIPMQERIAQLDAFNEWNETIGSSVYFILPGASEGEFIGEALFE